MWSVNTPSWSRMEEQHRQLHQHRRDTSTSHVNVLMVMRNTVILIIFVMMALTPPCECAALTTVHNADSSATGEKCTKVANLEIIFENDRVLAINKPSGIGHHGDGNTSCGILQILRDMQQRQLIKYQGRLYGVHRLDKVTSGILLFAKDRECAGLIGKALREKQLVTKFYFALSAKKPKKRKQGTIRGDMAKARRGSWQLTRRNDNPAITKFYTAGLGELNKQCGAINNTTVARTALLLRPITGKTHQLRVASKSEGMPILGDELYGGRSDTLDGLSKRTYLHSAALHLHIEQIGEICIISPPPFDLLWSEACMSPEELEEIKISFENLFCTLMTKHCENEELLYRLKTQ